MGLAQSSQERHSSDTRGDLGTLGETFPAVPAGLAASPPPTPHPLTDQCKVCTAIKESWERSEQSLTPPAGGRRWERENLVVTAGFRPQARVPLPGSTGGDSEQLQAPFYWKACITETRQRPMEGVMSAK